MEPQKTTQPTEAQAPEQEAPKMGTSKDLFDLLDEVEDGGTPSLDDVATDVEGEISDEMGDNKTDEELQAEADAKQKQKETQDTGEQQEEQETDEQEKAEEKEEPVTDQALPEWLAEQVKALDEKIDVNDPEAVKSTLEANLKKATELESQLKETEQANAEFYELMEGSEELQDVLRFMFKHQSDLPTALMALDIAPEQDLEALKKEDPDAYLEAVEKRKAMEAAKAEAEKTDKEKQELYQANEEKTLADLEAFKKEYELDDDGLQAVAKTLNPYIDQMAQGYTSKDFLGLIYKGMNAQASEKDAYERGLAEGRNQSIEQLQQRKSGDGLPALRRTTNKPKAGKEPTDIFDKALDGGTFSIPE